MLPNTNCTNILHAVIINYMTGTVSFVYHQWAAPLSDNIAQ